MAAWLDDIDDDDDIYGKKNESWYIYVKNSRADVKLPMKERYVIGLT